MEKEKRKWVGIINMHVRAYNLLYYTQLAIYMYFSMRLKRWRDKQIKKWEYRGHQHA